MLRCYVTDRRRGDIFAASARAVRDGIEIIQVREKDLHASELLALVLRIREIASGSKTQVLVNDRLDVAIAANVNGVHLPSNGLPADRVRPFVKTLGVSAHTIEEVVAAERNRPDYIIFGPIFETPGKQAIGLGPLRDAVNAVKVPVVAIGGITPVNLSEVMECGAGGIAAIRLFQNQSD